MRYIRLTFQYMFNKHFWKLALLVLLPSVAVSLFTSFNTTAHMIINFSHMEDYSFRSIYLQSSELSSGNWWKVLLGLGAALIVFAVMFAICIGTMQRHMRTGKFAITNVWKRINEHFLPSVITIGTVLLFLYVYGLLIDTTVVLWWAITHNQIATYVMTILSMVLLFVCLTLLFCFFSMVCPHMVATGAALGDSMGYSVRTAKHDWVRLWTAFALPLAGLMMIQFPFALVNVRAVHIIVDSLTMFFICTYFPVLMFVSYYQLTDRDREDLLPVNRM